MVTYSLRALRQRSEFGRLSLSMLRRVLWVTAAVTILAGVIERFVGIGETAGNGLFEMDGEGTFTSWFSSTLMLGIALLAAVLASHHARAGLPYRKHWAALSLIFVVLSLDESASLHEKAGQMLSRALNVPWDGFSWVLLALPIVPVVGLSYLRMVRDLPAQIRRWVVLGGALYLTGALLSEIVGGSLEIAMGHAFSATVIIEESLEILGLVIFLCAEVDYFAQGADEIVVTPDALE
jgi:hypothetical protein